MGIPREIYRAGLIGAGIGSTLSPALHEREALTGDVRRAA
jgi:hypothetical protein